jgi:phosphoglycolate phosphatase-like HAD superfamily hydrolase
VTPVESTEQWSNLSPRPGISHAVFDFDGTISWLRHGWPELMAGLFLEHIPNAPGQHHELLNDVLSLNGKSSIYQMERCAQRVAEHGGPTLAPQKMLKEYLDALGQLVAGRKEKIRRGEAGPDEFVVHGARSVLRQLHARGLVLVILSGTAQNQVAEEAELLGLAEFFGPHIYGSTADLLGSSKQAVLERLTRQEPVTGECLLSFGDGPVEIRLTKKAGGLAVGVASDEDHNGSGKLHPQKAAQLREAGADCLIADYREPDRLIKALLGA